MCWTSIWFVTQSYYDRDRKIDLFDYRWRFPLIFELKNSRKSPYIYPFLFLFSRSAFESEYDIGALQHGQGIRTLSGGVGGNGRGFGGASRVAESPEQQSGPNDAKEYLKIGSA
jgi:hypothetical protein